ncbi:hypothetical protein FOS14_19480 [Skermania sp. ID1734]|uniref:hypothetical protein n=1 Tax=Skermania sp. ID1734 TaxID=2597516 RepID=UPI00117E1D5C|nr:hypothetical protein [Skermania sp. ID1734]TSD94826.1 hypothetical protein FOS14_19480 [Skermania sp. ID1734]
MTYDGDHQAAETRSTLRRINDLRATKPYRTGTMLGSVAVLAVIVVWAVFAAVTGTDADTPQESEPPAVAVEPLTPPPGETAGIPLPEFGAPASDRNGHRIEVPVDARGQVLPQTQPAGDLDASAPPGGLMWQRVYGAPVPFSTTAGPDAISPDGVPTGFAHTPQGAAIAAQQICTRLIAAPREQARAIMDASVIIQGPGAQETADRMLALTVSESEIATLFPVPMAVKVSNYEGDYAHVEVALQMPATARQQGVIASKQDFDLVWADGTWKWVMPTGPTDRSARLMTALDEGWSMEW